MYEQKFNVQQYMCNNVKLKRVFFVFLKAHISEGSLIKRFVVRGRVLGCAEGSLL